MQSLESEVSGGQLFAAQFCLECICPYGASPIPTLAGGTAKV